MARTSSPTVRPRVLIADGAPLTRWALQRAFASEGFETCAVSGVDDLIAQLLERPDSLVVCASRFGDEDMMPMLRRMARVRPDQRVIALGAPDSAASDEPATPNLIVVEQPFSVADLLRIAGGADAAQTPQRDTTCL